MYPASLARVLTQETPKTLADHHRILVHVITTFGDDPPAALDLELGYYAWRIGKIAEAEAALERELTLHPELAPMIDRAALHIRTLPVIGESASELGER
jgi:hypothetical protein